MRLFALALFPILAFSSKVPKPDKAGKYHLKAPGITASFIPYGASLTNLWVPSKSGKLLDITLGFDTAREYHEDPIHAHFGGVPGRYANRIGDGSFKIDGKTYYTDRNDGNNTLHGGSNGWDYRNFTVTSVSDTAITFSLLDPAGSQGFPGAVLAVVTYSISKGALTMRMTGLSLDVKTPIMLTSHSYWNLDAFAKDTVLDTHKLWINKGDKIIDVDGELIPTGKISKIPKGHPNDFYSKPKILGKDLARTFENCGTNCTGYDNCWVSSLSEKKYRSEPITTLSSSLSGITLALYSNQPALQMYSCNFQDGRIPIKKTQGKGDGKQRVQKYGCIVLEAQDYIDAINNPKWGRESKQVFGPGEGYEFWARYEFGVQK